MTRYSDQTPYPDAPADFSEAERELLSRLLRHPPGDLISEDGLRWSKRISREERFKRAVEKVLERRGRAPEPVYQAPVNPLPLAAASVQTEGSTTRIVIEIHLFVHQDA